jgi:hypothetical protein
MDKETLKMNNFLFRFPDYSEDEWIQLLDREDGCARRILTTQIQTLNLAKSINDKRVTPARLAWVNLWTKCISLLDGTYTALSGHSTFILDVLARVTIETFLHTLTIADPLQKLRNKSPQSSIDSSMKVYDDVAHRLCAYTAWSLLSDAKYTWESLQKQNLDMVWSPEPARSIILNPNKYENHKSLFGEINIDIDPVNLRVGRMQQEEEFKQRRKRLQAWLEHPDLITWHQKISELNHQIKPNTVSFFTLFKEDEKTIRKKMQNIGFGFGYLIYKKASSIIHGSTMEQMNSIARNKIYPALISDHEDMEKCAEVIHAHCLPIALFLQITRKRVWS